MTETFLIGTYTRRISEGIYSIDLDTENATLSNLTVIARPQNPTYLQVSQANNLYSVVKDDDQGGTASFKLATGELINQVLGAGSPPAYIGIDEGRQLVFSSNYHLGTVTSMRIEADGALTLADTVTHQGLTGPRDEQDAPHVHYSDLTPDQRLVVCDLGLDTTFVYDIADDGKLTLASSYHSEAGFGSRHIAFHPDGKHAYLLGELSSKIEVLEYHASTAEFSHLQTIDTIPTNWTEHNGAAAIHLSSDGRFVYSSNRGENTIAVFEIQSNFELRHIQSISTAGDFPRDFELDATEKFIVAANQNTDNLTLYRRNSETGQLTILQQDVFAPEGVCVKQI